MNKVKYSPMCYLLWYQFQNLKQNRFSKQYPSIILKCSSKFDIKWILVTLYVTSDKATIISIRIEKVTKSTVILQKHYASDNNYHPDSFILRILYSQVHEFNLNMKQLKKKHSTKSTHAQTHSVHSAHALLLVPV